MTADVLDEETKVGGMMEMKPLLGRSRGLAGSSDGKIKRNKSSPR